MYARRMPIPISKATEAMGGVVVCQRDPGSSVPESVYRGAAVQESAAVLPPFHHPHLPSCLEGSRLTAYRRRRVRGVIGSDLFRPCAGIATVSSPSVVVRPQTRWVWVGLLSAATVPSE